jgi:tetratricopeptide (TPR) repeat protein
MTTRNPIRHELGDAIEIIKWPLAVPTMEGNEADAEKLIFSSLQEWLRATSCDVAIWGRVKNNDVLSLRFTVQEFGSTLPETYKLTDKLELPREFVQTLGSTIAMRICAPQWGVKPRPDLIEYLKASARRLESIIERGAFDDPVRAGLIVTYGRALLAVGRQQYSPNDIQRAVDAYKVALRTFTPERSLVIWKALSIALATSLRILAEHENSNLFVDAEGVYRAVLGQINPDADLIEWATVACDLGTVLSRMGERQIGAEKLREAIAVLRDAAEKCTREKVPLLWAFIMSSTASAYVTLGERQSEFDDIRNSIDCNEAALQEWTREQYPFLWAFAQNSLANAYRILGERRENTKDLEKAIMCARNSLKVRSRRREPVLWAHSQSHLGISLLALAKITRSVPVAKKAHYAIQRASGELTRERGLRDWAMTQINLGHVLLLLGGISERGDYLWAAIQICDDALRIVDLGNAPFLAAMLANNLGSAKSQLGKMLGRTESFEEAFQLHSAAMLIYQTEGATYFVDRTRQYVAMMFMCMGIDNRSRDSLNRWFELMSTIAVLQNVSQEQQIRPALRRLLDCVGDNQMSSDADFLAFCRYHIGNQQTKLAELTESHEELEEAKQNLLEAARLWDRECAPLAWARAEFLLGNLYLRGSEVGSSTAALDDAVAKLKGALAERERLKVPGDWAVTKMSLGWAHAVYSDHFTGWKAGFYLWRATRDCNEALEVLTLDGAAFNWAVAHNNLGIAYFRLAELLQSGNPFLRTAIRLLFGMPDEAATRSFLQALQVFSLDNAPLNWAMAKLNLSGAYLSRGIRQKNGSALRSAIVAADEATKVFTCEHAPLKWAMCAANRATGLATIGKIDGDTTPLREATTGYRQAIEVLQGKGAKVQLENTEKNLAEAMQVLEGLSAQ